MKLKRSGRWMAGAVAATFAFAALAKTTPEQAARLGADLTPLGGEKAGNADGSIPAWEGGLTAPAGYKSGDHHSDPFASESPLFVIRAADADKYADKLTAGHRRYRVTLDPADGAGAAWLHQHGEVLDQSVEGDRAVYEVRMAPSDHERFMTRFSRA